METPIRYKVVSAWSGGLCSATTLLKWQVKYIPGEWVEGVDFTPLFVFEHLADAELFADDMKSEGYEGLQVWSCETKDILRIYNVPFHSTDFSYFWRNKPLVLGGCTPCPPGSYTTPAVKLLERVS